MKFSSVRFFLLADMMRVEKLGKQIGVITKVVQFLIALPVKDYSLPSFWGRPMVAKKNIRMIGNF